jgi:exopolysaccharide production protein ExoY
VLEFAEMAQLVNLSRDRSLTSLETSEPIGLTSKRFIDIILAGSAIILLAPLLILCFVFSILASSGPALFRHRRVGFRGRYFECLKFRTMVPNSDERLREYLAANPEANREWIATRKLRFDPRVTALGSILRKTSLDELPQLFNVLMGDMSIVGPRPVTEEELVRYSTSIRAYLSCRPGITGLWQVSGRSGTTYSRRIACDTFYARNWSLMLDAEIMLLTIPAILNSENTY